MVLDSRVHVEGLVRVPLVARMVLAELAVWELPKVELGAAEVILGEAIVGRDGANMAGCSNSRSRPSNRYSQDTVAGEIYEYDSKGAL